MKNVERLEELAGQIYALNDALAVAHSRSLADNKSAARHARKLTLQIEKACKEYRKLSLEATKE